jgi:putative colanic acid biosynthesis acetyltransferase WcaF
MERDLSRFENKSTGSRTVVFFMWLLVQNIFFKSFWFPSRLRVFTLRLFGAQIGRSVLIRRGVRVHFPKNLVIGDNSWIGEDVWFINHEKIEVGENVCISQAAIVCSSGHDLNSTFLDYKHAKIKISSGAWVCLRATLLAGSIVGKGAVVSAGEIFSGNLPDSHLFRYGKSRKIQG